MSFQVLTTEWWTASYQHRVRFRVGSLFKTLRNLRRKTLQVVDPEQGNPDIWVGGSQGRQPRPHHHGHR
jgi:hypothetical protein